MPEEPRKSGRGGKAGALTSLPAGWKEACSGPTGRAGGRVLAGGWRRESPRVLSSDFHHVKDLKSGKNFLAGPSYM